MVDSVTKFTYSEWLRIKNSFSFIVEHLIMGIWRHPFNYQGGWSSLFYPDPCECNICEIYHLSPNVTVQCWLSRWPFQFGDSREPIYHLAYSKACSIAFAFIYYPTGQKWLLAFLIKTLWLCFRFNCIHWWLIGNTFLGHKLLNLI